jgi:glycosyltransferase involved in cell wall biosynthesis
MADKALKVYYCYTSGGLTSSSVQDKIVSQIHALCEAGVDCRGVFFTTAVEQETQLSPTIVLLPVRRSTSKWFRPLDQAAITLHTMDTWLKAHAADADFVYLRYPGASAALYRMAKRLGRKLVSEHQSKEIIEILESRNEHPFGLRPSKFLSWLQFQFLPLFNERRYGKRYARRIGAIVTMTHELAAYHSAKGCKQVTVIPNGIDTARFPVRSVPAAADCINLLFLKGTSTLASWNGLDRLIASVDAYHATRPVGALPFRILICGKFMEGEIPSRDYIEHLGYLRGAELEAVFNRAHLAVSTLCSYRRGLEESAILKTREYFARGIPFIFAYTDVDFDNSETVRTNTLRFPNSDARMDMAAVEVFARGRMTDLQHPADMHAWAEAQLDYRIKMKKLRDFLLELQQAS